MRISRSHYYHWLIAPKTKREKENKQLIEKLKILFEKVLCEKYKPEKNQAGYGKYKPLKKAEIDPKKQDIIFQRISWKSESEEFEIRPMLCHKTHCYLT